MGGLAQQHPYAQQMESVAVRSKYLADNTLLYAVENMEELDSKKLTSEERHALYMHAFALNLADEGLRSPDYYRDKSPCISFHEDAWPAEIGIYKAKILKWGYIEPEELIRRLNELKPSENFTLRKYRHRQMEWDKSPIPESPEAVSPPPADWFDDQVFFMTQKKRKRGPYTDRDLLIDKYCDEARDYWKNICDIDLTPLPDSHLLKHIGRSPSGTLFPRYLVKGLHSLRKRADRRGEKYYDQEYEKAKIQRSEIIQRWQDENPDSILADDPLSIYRIWPAELMAQLNALDQEAMCCGSRRYIADLLETEKEMQKLVSFWRECGLITGLRTPPSPQWPDPKAKLRGLHWPDYLMQRLKTIRKECGFSKEGEKRRIIQMARWKEAVLNTDSDPSISEMPLSPSLQDQLDIAWQGYENFLDQEDVEDEIIAKISQRRKSNLSNPCFERPRTSQLDCEVDREGTTDKTIPAPSYHRSSPHEDEGIVTDGEAELQFLAQSPSIATVKTYKSIPSLSRSDSIALEEASHFFRTFSRKDFRHRNFRARPTADGTTWSGRLRPRSAPEGPSPKLPKARKKPVERPGGVVKRRGKGSAKRPPHQLLSNGVTLGSQIYQPLPSRPSSPQYPILRTPLQTRSASVQTKGILQAQYPLSNRAMSGQPQGVRKARKSKRKPSKSHRPGHDKRNEELVRILTPPESQ